PCRLGTRGGAPARLGAPAPRQLQGAAHRLPSRRLAAHAQRQGAAPRAHGLARARPCRMEGRGMKKLVARMVLWLGGWTVEGTPPTAPRCVLIAFPHTSNWDFIWTLAFAWALDVEISWMGKEEMFRWPFGGFMRALGGVPVHRK